LKGVNNQDVPGALAAKVSRGLHSAQVLPYEHHQTTGLIVMLLVGSTWNPWRESERTLMLWLYIGLRLCRAGWLWLQNQEMGFWGAHFHVLWFV
jgi:hypothetical protein